MSRRCLGCKHFLQVCLTTTRCECLSDVNGHVYIPITGGMPFWSCSFPSSLFHRTHSGGKSGPLKKQGILNFIEL